MVYIDVDIKVFVKGKLIGADGKDVDATDFRAGTNNFLHSLSSQCSISLNGLNITPASELYPTAPIWKPSWPMAPTRPIRILQMRTDIWTKGTS